MNKLSSGLTWAELKAHFSENAQYSLILNHVKRRAKKGLRNKGEQDSRTLWRCILQRNDGKQTTTMYRKNIHFDGKDLAAQKVSPTVIASINNMI